MYVTAKSSAYSQSQSALRDNKKMYRQKVSGNLDLLSNTFPYVRIRFLCIFAGTDGTDFACV